MRSGIYLIINNETGHCSECGNYKSHMGKVCRGCMPRSGSNNPMYGVTLSAESKRRGAASRKRVEDERRSRGIPASCGRCPSIDGVIYMSLAEAAKEKGVHLGTIASRCKNVNFPNYFYTR